MTDLAACIAAVENDLTREGQLELETRMRAEMPADLHDWRCPRCGTLGCYSVCRACVPGGHLACENCGAASGRM